MFASEKFHQYTFDRHVKVQSDRKPLESILQKPLSSAPQTLQGMMLRIQGYDITVTYEAGKEMFLADTLSRAYITVPSQQEEFERLEKLKKATEEDENLQKLKEVILNGWPTEKSSLSPELTPFYSFRDELTVQDQLIFKRDRVVVPASQRSEMKQSLHSTHVGIDACLKWARECLYWPGMTDDLENFISTCEMCQTFLENFISTCEMCQTFHAANQPETLQPHDILQRQWEKVRTDLSELYGKDYMVTVDCFSSFWELDRLDNTKNL